MKHVLIFTSFFPPANESAARRTGCFAKYLPEFGWTPTVVCREWDETNCDCDQSLLEGINPAHILASVTDRIEGRYPAFAANFSHKIQKVLSPKRYPTQWTKNVINRMDSICNSSPFDVVLGSCGPASSLFLAREAAQRMGVPWVADFRDLSCQAGTPDYWKDALVSHRLRIAERSLARSATFCTTTTEGQAELIRRWRNASAHVIPNGFDPAEFADLEAKEPSQKFDLVHAGSLYPHRSPQPFLDALASLVTKGKIKKDDLSVKFYGVPEGDTFHDSLMRDYKYPEIVSPIGKVDSGECRSAFRQASILMLPGEPAQVTVGAKLYEYVASGTPTVVGPPPHDAAKQIIASTGAGFVAETQQDLETILHRCYREWGKTGQVSCHPDKEMVEQYSRRKQTLKLAQHLDTLCQQPIFVG